MLPYEKNSYHTFESKIVQEKFNRFNDKDFEEAVKSAVKTIQEISMEDRIITSNVPQRRKNKFSINSSQKEILKKTREINKKKNSPLSDTETVFNEVVTDMFTGNPEEKFNIGSRTFSQGKRFSLGTSKFNSVPSKSSALVHDFFNFSQQKKLDFGVEYVNKDKSYLVDLSTFKPSNLLKISQSGVNTNTKRKSLKSNNGLAKLKTMLCSEYPSLQLEAIKGVRQMFTLRKDILSADLLDKDVIPILLHVLRTSKIDVIKIESLWALSAVSVGSVERTQLLLQHGAIAILGSVLRLKSSECLEQAVWVVGNLASDDVSARDALLKSKVLGLILQWIDTCLDSKKEQNSNPFENSGIFTKGFEPNFSSGYPVFDRDYCANKNTTKNVHTTYQTRKGKSSTGMRSSFKPYSFVNLLKIASWTLSNLCDGQPRPVLDVDPILIRTRRIFRFSKDDEVLSHVCWALSHMCDGSSLCIDKVVKSGVCKNLVQLLTHKAWRVVKPALRAVGNIVCAEDEEQDYTQHIIECGAIPLLTGLIKHPHKDIQKEACWTISNISAGTTKQIQIVLNSGAIPELIKLANASKKMNDKTHLRRKHSTETNNSVSITTNITQTVDNSVDPDVKIEACWVLLNATSCGNENQIIQLVKWGCVEVLCSLLMDSSMVLMALEGIEKILQVGERVGKEMIARLNNEPNTKISIGRSENSFNPHAIQVNPVNILALQKHRSMSIAKRAKKIWKDHFVTCAICKDTFSKYIQSAMFCQECKCFVCINCNCSVFHLSYQDKIWRELIDEEELVNKKDKTDCKSKRQKKREKNKKRKQRQKQQQQKNVALVNDDEHQHTRERSLFQESSVVNDACSTNDLYVDFLLEKGSILDLWNLMDDVEQTKSTEKNETSSKLLLSN